MVRLGTLLLILGISIAPAQAEVFRLQWEDIVVEQEHQVRDIFDHSQPPGSKAAKCLFLYGKIDCWEVEVSEDTTYPFGHDYPLQVPVAIFPELDPYDDGEALIQGMQYEYPQDQVSRLPEFVPKVPPKAQWAKLRNAYLGASFESTGFSDANRTLGGPEVLAMWNNLAMYPTSPADCFRDYCYIAVAAEGPEGPAIFWCSSFSDGESFAPPYPQDCALVAFAKNDIPYLLSYTGADLCDGCGAGGGFYCAFTQTPEVTTDFVAESLVAFMGDKPFALNMQRQGEMLIGKHTAKESLWKEGYYERAFATALVTQWDDGDIIVNLTYNLLVSSEPSADDHVYHGLSARDLGERSSDYDWFQQRLAELFMSNYAQKIDPSSICSYSEF